MYLIYNFLIVNDKMRVEKTRDNNYLEKLEEYKKYKDAIYVVISKEHRYGKAFVIKENKVTEQYTGNYVNYEKFINNLKEVINNEFLYDDVIRKI